MITPETPIAVSLLPGQWEAILRELSGTATEVIYETLSLAVGEGIHDHVAAEREIGSAS